MSYLNVELPYYRAAVFASGGGWYDVTFTLREDDGNGGIPGYTQDQIADVIRDALAGLTGVISHDLNKYTETATPL